MSIRYNQITSAIHKFPNNVAEMTGVANETLRQLLGLRVISQDAPQLRRVIQELFTSDGHGAEDPLMDIVRRLRHGEAQQEGGVRNLPMAFYFLESVMLFHGVTCFAAFLFCAGFLALEWHDGAALTWPLRLWLFVYALSQLLQAPVRLVLRSKLRHCERDGGSFESCIAKFTGSPVWIFSARVSALLYAWFAVGIVWLLQNQSSVDAAEASAEKFHKMVRYAIAQAFVRTFIVLAYSWWVLPPAPPTESAVPKVIGLSREEIAELPIVRYLPGQGQDTCTICLADFEGGERLRSLPCSHQYHQRCLDKWLRRCNRCPLCNRSVGAADAHRCT